MPNIEINKIEITIGANAPKVTVAQTVQRRNHASFISVPQIQFVVIYQLDTNASKSISSYHVQFLMYHDVLTQV